MSEMLLCAGCGDPVRWEERRTPGGLSYTVTIDGRYVTPSAGQDWTIRHFRCIEGAQLSLFDGAVPVEDKERS